MSGHHCHTLFAIITRDNFVRTAGEAGQAAWRIPAASAAGIVRSGPGAGRDVREWEDRNGVCVRTGRHRRRGRGSSGSPAPLRGREANARPRPAGLPGPAGRHRAAGSGRARAGPDRHPPHQYRQPSPHRRLDRRGRQPLRASHPLCSRQAARRLHPRGGPARHPQS